MTPTFEISTPTLCPRQTCKEQDKREEGNIDSRSSMNISPEGTPALAQTRIEHAAETMGIARPPEIEAGDDHNRSPRCGEFHDRRTEVAHQQFTVQPEDDVFEAHVFVDDMQNLRGLRMHIDAELPRASIDKDLCSRGWCVRQFISVERGLWHSGKRCLHLLIGGSALRNDQMIVRPIKITLDLRFE
jgi:hypothetical protein